MTNEEFEIWASAQDLPTDLTRQLIEYALTSEDIQAMDPEDDDIVLLTYTLNDFTGMADGQELEGLGIAPGKEGFWLLGFCPDGDPIALDVRNDVGSVWYLSHESMHHQPLRDNCAKVADSIEDFIARFDEEDDFPWDYYEAKEQGGG